MRSYTRVRPHPSRCATSVTVSKSGVADMVRARARSAAEVTERSWVNSGTDGDGEVNESSTCAMDFNVLAPRSHSAYSFAASRRCGSSRRRLTPQGRSRHDTIRRVRRIFDASRPDGGRGTTEAVGPRQAESSSGLRSTRAGTRSARAARGGGPTTTGAAPAIRHILRRSPHHSRQPPTSPAHRHSSSGFTDSAPTPTFITLSSRPRTFTSHTLAPTGAHDLLASRKGRRNEE